MAPEEESSVGRGQELRLKQKGVALGDGGGRGEMVWRGSGEEECCGYEFKEWGRWGLAGHEANWEMDSREISSAFLSHFSNLLQ